MLVNLYDLRKDLKTLGINAKVCWTDKLTGKLMKILKSRRVSNLNIIFKNEEDRNYYKLAGEYSYVNLLVK